MKRQMKAPPAYTSKQMGDACEMLVAAELTLAGIPALKVPDNWPGYDIIAQPQGREPLKISVKSRTFKQGAAYIEYKQTDDFDWLAIVILPSPQQTDQSRRFFLVPRHIADAKARKSKAGTKTENDRYWSIAEAITLFAPFENNFTLRMIDA